MIIQKVTTIKLDRSCLSQCKLLYTRSIVLPPQILSSSNIGLGGNVSIYNFNNRGRYDTYMIAGEDNITVGINGPRARLC